MNSSRGQKIIPSAAALLVFILLATLNSAGYRYGASDQAFYIPAVLRDVDPSLFPHDGPLIESQARLTVIDEAIGALTTTTGISLPWLFAGLYVLTLGLLALAGKRLGDLLYRHRWTTVALLAALTLRHAIARTGANSLESYFHPRQLAFALGALALGAFLRRRYALMLLLTLGAAAVHTTTTMWFGVWMFVATAVAEPRWRRALTAGAALGAIAASWAIVAGPLAGRAAPMDAEWLATLSTKNYLFPRDWPLYVWTINLGYIAVILFVLRRRAAAGVLTSRERAAAIGCLSLTVLFLCALLLHRANIAIAVQLQPARIFWMLDLLAIAYGVWALAEDAKGTARRARTVALAILVASIARGAYVMAVRFPDRRIADLDIRADDWGRVMAWARTTDRSSQWLADPLHAVYFGTSLRVAGERDVFVEAVKDTAIGMYDRGVAMRTRDRLAELGDPARLTAVRARALAHAHGLDYLVTDLPLDLPLAFESGSLRVYRLTE